ncbi:MAG: hypothetical protein A2008_12345 [Candidatus Wallbacteria bacterium GWC2_49_35]|uniref:HK97 gp10 family phage protein n=1 Tax=Candidatus Wallbacteria bacterium GWC2_49_35 TaxID=1817813 RepID=A0A1F7WZT0_9BACT|nr:MAG: hypothetical protein A2008_12345 [Candidatus Wallbacteria bacterium GWC2_49_35]
MRIALKESMRAIQNRARSEHRFRSSTNSSAERSVSTQVTSEYPPEGRVFLDEAVARHALFIHEGTKPHAIPKGKMKKKALRWLVAGGFAFAKHVWHPGTKPDPFLYKAAEAEKSNVNNIFDRHINKALSQLSRWKGKI